MSNKFAIPVSYGDPRSGIGSVKIVASKGPPLSVEQWTEADGEDNKHIAIEFEDIIKTVERDHGLTDSEVMRLCLHLADARKLTHNLITRLAESGDRVAKHIQQAMNDGMEIVRALDNAPVDLRASFNRDNTPVALCNLHLTGLDRASFNLCWPIDLQHGKQPNRLDMSHTDWPVPQAEPTRNPETFSMERLRLKEEVFTMLRIIRKYAEVLGVLLKMQDDNQILRGIDYKPILDPYNAPEPMIYAQCRLFRVHDEKIKLWIVVGGSSLPLINITTTESELGRELIYAASVASNKNLFIKFIEGENLVANHNLKSIFGKNLCDVP